MIIFVDHLVYMYSTSKYIFKDIIYFLLLKNYLFLFLHHSTHKETNQQLDIVRLWGWQCHPTGATGPGLGKVSRLSMVPSPCE